MGGQDLLVTIGVIHTGRVPIQGGYGVLFISITHFDTKDCYYFKSNLSLVFLIKVFLKRSCNVVLKPSKHKEITFPSEFVFVFISYFIEGILSKECCQK